MGDFLAAPNSDSVTASTLLFGQVNGMAEKAIVLFGQAPKCFGWICYRLAQLAESRFVNR